MPSLASPPLRLPHTDANPSAQLRPVKRSPNSCLPRAPPKRCGISTSGASHRIRQVEPCAEQIPFLSFLFLNGHLHSPIVLAVPASTGTLTRSACPMIHACGFAFSRTGIRSCAWDKHRRHGKGHGDHASSDPTLGSPVHSASKNKNGHCQI